MIALTEPRIASSALAFRGYNQTNLGRTPELLEIPAYRATMERRLLEAADLCEQATGRPTDLVARVTDRAEPGLERYAEAIAIVFAAEMAQVDLLREVHGVEVGGAKMAYGYSLGELVAVAVSGLYPIEQMMRPPLELATDCASMASECTMAVLFSRSESLNEARIHRLCEEITAAGEGAVAVSAVLSPNTLLVLGEGETIRRLKSECKTLEGPAIHVRNNDGLWPPLHTPLVRRLHVPDRAALMIRESTRLSETPRPPIWSLVTGRREYEEDSGREVLRRWVDSPQRLWDVVEATLAADVRTVIHIGPEPNVIPATFTRLADNVVKQTLAWSLSGVGMRTVQQMAHSSWLTPLLPRSGCLLRAPRVEHVVLEDWLLENAPA
ncbi:hypothetical protein MalM25_15180 [Planctomycetes bacterium MalM25]|nr:hypothetical protein MalM25_15180 [Planctomycetes bacterium MalM25]